MFRHPAVPRAAVLAAACLFALPAAAQDETAGAALYAGHCAYCHGATGAGDGPQASVLNPQPKDLTRLAAENGGTFPTLRVVRRIDGRDPLVAHGSPMPVFGEFFEGEGAAVKTGAGQPILTSRPVADLVAWLATIQAAD